ncbi:helicase C-terminal domain-containing protein [Clostridium akagii]|uniref:helicase C-terminal domain-containing protein n=1 Tax=Clostridium akagii TaxID=91623 RepID=UPI000478F2E9|nr:helicase C-terminal domain-containing protein [Clostridium akagii]
MKPYSILNNLVFLDIKTTGNDPKNDKIIKISAIKIKEKKVTKFDALVNPNRSVPLNILGLCKGITQEKLSSASEFKEVMKKLKVFFEDLPLVCHDLENQKSFLNVNNKFLDSLELVAILFPELPEFNLKYLIKKFIPDSKNGKHRELSYVEEIIEVLNFCLSRFYSENGYTLSMSLIDLEGWDWYTYISNVNMDDVKYFLDNNEAIKLGNKERKPYPVFALKDYEKLFENKKIWKRGGRSYTLRPEQRDASKFVREGLQNEKITIMEAPTGLGKSMAYLLPAIIHTHLKQEKIIISTNTKGLQNQLVNKDIPNLLEALDLKRDIKYTIIKGKNNYLCIDGFQDIEFPKDMKTLIGYVYLKRLITEKGIGDIEDISDDIKEKFNLKELLEKCICDTELCDSEKCKYKDRCYYALRVEDLKESQLIVVNHSLLLRWSYQSIAPLDNIVVDEAHNLSKEVYEAYEENLISYEFEKFLKDIYNSSQKSGYLYYLSTRTKKDILPLSDVESDIEKCSDEIKNIRGAFENYVKDSKISREYNIKEHLNKSNSNIAKIIKYLGCLKEDMARLNINLDKAITVLKNIANLEKDKSLKILIEKVEVINDYIRFSEDIANQSIEDYCFYFEVDKNFNWWKIASIPLDVSGVFYEKVLKGAKSCLFLSATLSTDNSYNNLKNTLGINIAKSQNKEIVEVMPIKPIFQYRDKSVIYAIENIDPNDAQTFSQQMKKFVVELSTNVEGNIIVLFTSRKRLNAFKNEATEELNTLGITVVEGKKDIEKLKSREVRYILLGSKGFFEGIDIPGDAMATVVLDKLPNINSNEPFYKSLIEKNIEKGASYWNAYSKVNFPIVSIDLKQIYGRLIRTEYDYGSLFIMSKFDGNNQAVKKLENQLYGVPIIRKSKDLIFQDLNLRRVRWKQINLYKIMKEVKSSLKKSILVKNSNNKIKSIKETEDFINLFLSLEYKKRNLKYDVNISLEGELAIYIGDKEVKLGRNTENIKQYFKEVVS